MHGVHGAFRGRKSRGDVHRHERRVGRRTDLCALSPIAPADRIAGCGRTPHRSASDHYDGSDTEGMWHGCDLENRNRTIFAASDSHRWRAAFFRKPGLIIVRAGSCNRPAQCAVNLKQPADMARAISVAGGVRQAAVDSGFMLLQRRGFSSLGKCWIGRHPPGVTFCRPASPPVISPLYRLRNG